MTRQPRYGEINSRVNKEAWRIWTERFTEPEPLEVVEAPPAGQTEVADQVLLRAVEKALLDIRPRYVEVLLRRHFFGQTLEEVGSELDLTRERVRQIEKAAIRQVRNRIPEAIEGFFF